MMKNKRETDSRKILIPLILSLVGFTALYQLRPFLSDFEFSYVSFPAYTIVPAVLVGFSSLITIKLYKRKHFQNPITEYAYNENYWTSAVDPDGNEEDQTKMREFKIKNWYGEISILLKNKNQEKFLM